jgi:hypothetical protein
MIDAPVIAPNIPGDAPKSVAISGTAGPNMAKTIAMNIAPRQRTASSIEGFCLSAAIGAFTLRRPHRFAGLPVG